MKKAFGYLYKDKKKVNDLVHIVVEKEQVIQEEYELSQEYISKFPNTIQNNIDEMFTKNTTELNITPTAKKVFTQTEPGNETTPAWATWIWEVSYKTSANKT